MIKRIHPCKIGIEHFPTLHITAGLGGGGFTGGAATSYSASLNWYPNRNVLIGLNYTYMDNDKYADDKGHITLDGKPLSQMLPSGLDFSILQLRLLLSF